ncbi:hypothetical protein ACFX2I_005422 [Malus domestica]
MYSETHSWMVSLASSEILACGGRILRMILITLAIGMKRSCSRTMHSLSSAVPLVVLALEEEWLTFLLLTTLLTLVVVVVCLPIPMLYSLISAGLTLISDSFSPAWTLK